MKEDVLEQIVDDYLQFKGYFTIHNIRFKPSPDNPGYIADQDRVPSDVDVVGIHPRGGEFGKVVVVSCKSWQGGFNAGGELKRLMGEKSAGQKEAWRRFRELWVPKWSEGLRDTIRSLTGESVFSYRIAVTRLVGEGDPADWGRHPRILENLDGSSFGFLTLEEMWATMLAELKRTPASSEIGRLAQLLKAAGLTAGIPLATPEGPAPGSDAEAVALSEEEEPT